MTEMPNKVKIGPHDYDIEVIDKDLADALNVNGRLLVDKKKIQLCPLLESSLLAEVIVHEIMHIIYKNYSIQDGDDEERVVSSFGLGVTEVIKRNPTLFEFIKEKVQS